MMDASLFFHGADAANPVPLRSAGAGCPRVGLLLLGCVLALANAPAAFALGWGAPGGVGANGVSATAVSVSTPAGTGGAAHASGQGSGGVAVTSSGPGLRAGGPAPGANVFTGPRLGVGTPSMTTVPGVRNGMLPPGVPGRPSTATVPTIRNSSRLATITAAAPTRRLPANAGLAADQGPSPSVRPAPAGGDVMSRAGGSLRPAPQIGGGAGRDRLANNPDPSLRRDRRAGGPRLAGREIYYPPYQGGYGPNNGYGYGGFGYGNGYDFGYGAAGCALGVGTYPFFTGYPVYAGLSYPVFLGYGSSYATAAPTITAAADTAPPPAAPAAAVEEDSPPSTRQQTPRADRAGTTTRRAGESNSLVEAVQEELVARGYLSGKPNGVLGAGTQEALRHFQANHGLPPTGRVNEATLFSLGLN